jgi:hypothetical protein
MASKALNKDGGTERGSDERKGASKDGVEV